MNITPPKCKFMMALVLLAALLLPAAASANMLTFTIEVGEKNPITGEAPLDGYASPYASVQINQIDNTHAIITVTASSSYRMGAEDAFAFNTATGVTAVATNITWTGGNNNTKKYTLGGGSNVATFGVFTNTIKGFDGFNSAVHQWFFDLTASGGEWSDAAHVFAPNGQGWYAAAHMFITNPQGDAALMSGEAAGKYQAPSSPAPVPASVLLLGSGLIGLGLLGWRRTKRAGGNI